MYDPIVDIKEMITRKRLKYISVATEAKLEKARFSRIINGKVDPRVSTVKAIYKAIDKLTKDDMGVKRVGE